MARTAFDFDAGTYQGRIPSATAPLGSYTYELGHALPNRFVRVSSGDSNDVAQTADFATTPLTRVRVRVRPAESMPDGLLWVLSANVGSDTYKSWTIDRARVLADVALPTQSAGALGGGANSVSFVLSLVGSSGVYDVELPSAQLDAIVLDATTDPVVLANRGPEPNEVEVPVAGPVDFDLLSADGATAVDPTLASVYVDGVLAFSGGGARPGFSGNVRSLPDAASQNFSIAHDVAWDPDTVHTVRVVYQDPGAGASIDSTWTFRTADTLGPRVASATGTGDRSVLVAFDEPLLSAGAPDDYAIVLVSGAPAVTPTVESVESRGDGSNVLLTLDTEQTPGAVYRVTVLGVTDALGNPIVAPYNTATWTGYRCAVPAGREFDLYGMLLEHDRRQDESGDLRSFVACYQEVVDLLLCKIDRFLEIVDPDTAPEAWLDLMLADLGNPFQFDLTANDKRKLLSVLVAVYRSKGTDPGIVNAIRLFLGLEVTISVPWHTGWVVGVSILGTDTYLSSSELADRYSYDIVSPIALADEQRARILSIARFMQRAPCHVRVREPEPPPESPDHWQLGLSTLGVNTFLHDA